MKKTPLALVKERFESKEKLAAAVEKLADKGLWLDRTSTRGLGRVSNAKLLHLHEVLTQAKKDFGSRDKLITAILDAEKRSRDAGYKTRLEGHPLPRLLDRHRAATRRNARAEKAAKAKPAPKKKAASKAESASA